MRSGACIVIGVCGGSGSGKSSLADHLQALLGKDAAVIRQDWYYRDCSHLAPTARAQQNFDHPDALDLAEFTNHLQRLTAGQAIRPPDYCFETHSRRPGQCSLGPARVLIAEGLFMFNCLPLRSLYDLKVFIHADSDLRLLRRMHRDIDQRGRSLHSVSTQYLSTVKPMHEQHVEPNRQLADIVIGPTDLAQLANCARELAETVAKLPQRVEKTR